MHKNVKVLGKPKKNLRHTAYLCPEAMQADLAQLHKHILETHPNPTYYGNLNDLTEAFDKAKAKESSNRSSVFDFCACYQYLSFCTQRFTYWYQPQTISLRSQRTAKSCLLY